jgi:hypothetical protein
MGTHGVGEGEARGDEKLLHVVGSNGDLEKTGLELRDGGNVAREHAKHASGSRDDNHVDLCSDQGKVRGSVAMSAALQLQSSARSSWQVRKPPDRDDGRNGEDRAEEGRAHRPWLEKMASWGARRLRVSFWGMPPAASAIPRRPAANGAMRLAAGRSVEMKALRTLFMFWLWRRKNCFLPKTGQDQLGL